eukprot:m.109071 g.109071  ORF g.109071 m.109071 type:complete len:191 (-) comp27925_c4_seq2:407-979(-)
MGCPNSRPTHVDEDRAYNDGHNNTSSKAATPNPRRPGATQPVAMNANSPRANLPVESGIAKSYTDHRIEEADFFESIIKRTENALINASDFHDDIEEARNNTNTSAGLRQWQSSMRHHVTTLPPRPTLPPSEETDVVQVLSAPNISNSTTLIGSKALSDFSRALAKIQPKSVGEVVAFLPDWTTGKGLEL